jgi:hypothetical protein
MPLQNRVDPFGRLHAVPARGTLMGNRGILHDDHRTVVRSHAHQNWVSCTLSHKNVRRIVMAPRRYTELFFLDEATALAAGHRPCATCRRADYRAFTRLWERVHGGAEAGRTLPHTIDRILHRARIARGQKVTYEAPVEALPDGTIFMGSEGPLLAWQGRAYRWSFEGYGPASSLPQGMVQVLTPEPLVAMLAKGYRPQVHPSLAAV